MLSSWSWALGIHLYRKSHFIMFRQWCVWVDCLPGPYTFSFANSCMESAEGQRMIQKHDEIMQLLKRSVGLEIPVEMLYLSVIYWPIYLPPLSRPSSSPQRPSAWVWKQSNSSSFPPDNPAISSIITPAGGIVRIAITLPIRIGILWQYVEFHTWTSCWHVFGVGVVWKQAAEEW